ncbi:hypothetical protein DPMN_016672 [Dreissena polymorpha]|uniref:Uncharacterized protein n=1 Tax=Dreissena polymorpha TaxID=45954 RepID=A0A9D4NDI7_DREPO|nr:hypothetical protein DPMN_016672 [Dreissena polymorpha]
MHRPSLAKGQFQSQQKLLTFFQYNSMLQDVVAYGQNRANDKYSPVIRLLKDVAVYILRHKRLRASHMFHLQVQDVVLDGCSNLPTC